MTLSRGWKILLVVIGIAIALTAVSFFLFHTGETVPANGEGDPLTGLTTP